MAALEREPAGRATNLEKPLEEIAATVRKRGLVILISDLLAPTGSLAAKLGYLRSRGHDVIVLRVLDPAEVGFTFSLPAMFQDVESGRELYIDPAAAKEQYLKRFASHAAEIERACVDLGIEYELVDDRPAARARAPRSLEGPHAAGAAAGPQNGAGSRRCAVSFLFPWYILGLSAILAPVVLHLIRRVPRGEVPFSSVMFLSATPPRLTRRSRLDQWLLLLLRAAAFCLLAFAFARPFWRQETRLGSDNEKGSRIAVLVDTSASMRRGNLWPRAKALAQEVIASCRPMDELAVFSFDDSFKQVLGFAESSTLEASRRQAVALAAVEHLAPSWGSTRLGQALIESVSVIGSLADADAKGGRMPRRVVLISDLQQGSRLSELGDFEWPSDIELELRTVSHIGSNAGLQALDDLPEAASSSGDAQGTQRRVRVTNDPDSQREKFELVWIDETKPAEAKPIEVYVPAGESRVVRLPHSPRSSPRRTLRLKGDSFDFDNTLYFADSRRDEKTVYFVGKDKAADPAGLLYYLERVFLDTFEQTVRVIAAPPGTELKWDSDRAVPLVIVTIETTPANVRRLQEYVRSGGTVLWVPTAPGRAETLATVAGVPPFDVDLAAGRTDVMLRDIKFDHPLFTPFAAAQFNDFTKIHFWRHRRLSEPALGEFRVLARFEDGDIALAREDSRKGKALRFDERLATGR